MWSGSDEDYGLHYPYYDEFDIEDESEYDDEDIFGLYDSDNTDFSPPSSPAHRKSVDIVDTDSEEEPCSYEVPSLVDISSRFVALNFPFAYIEHRNPPVPDELQLKVISFSFPDNEELVRKYAEFSRNSLDVDYASRLRKTGCVKNLTQIGFRLSAVVEDRRCCGREAGKNYVAIQFDRGKITSVQCSCTSNPQMTWCNHVVATAFERIASKQDTAKVCIRLPVSDSLNLLNREQLLKFAQYLLCEHNNEPIVDSAQQLLDKLLCHGGTQNEEDDINTVAGAPDLTAGPGMDEDAQWFISKDGLKSKFDFVIYQDLVELGFESCGKEASQEPASVYLHELWRKFSLHPALLKDLSRTSSDTVAGRLEATKNSSVSPHINLRDEIDRQIDLIDHHGSVSRMCGNENMHLLKIIPNLLRDDSNSAVAALQACTEWLVMRLKRAGHRGVFRTAPPPVPPDGVPERNVSLAGGFTPRPFSCGTIVYEVSRLWRIAVLDPKLSVKSRQELLEQLTKWDEEVKKCCRDGNLCMWQGLEVSVRLGQLYQQSAEISAIMKRPWLTVPTISCMVVHFNVGTEFEVKREETEKEEKTETQESSNDEEMLEASKDSPSSTGASSFEPSIFFLPDRVEFGDSFTLDVHTACSLVEALIIYSNPSAALHLAVALSAGIVSFYRGAFHNISDPSELLVSETTFIGRNASERQRRPDSEEYAGSTTGSAGADSEEYAGSSTGSAGVWPKGILLTVTTFAFLYDVLQKRAEDADAVVMEMSSDWIKSAKSLMFQLGLFGLYVPKLPSPGKQQEVEQYEHESWLTHELLNAIPSDQDKELLSSFGHRILRSSVLCQAAPPSSLARVIFHHLFVEAPLTVDISLTAAQSLGLDVAFHVLRTVNVQNERSESWCFFQYSVCRLWSKLTEAVLRCLSDNKPLLDKAMSCILSQEGLLGLGAEMQKSSVSAHRQMPLVEIKCRVAYGLARAVAATSSGADNQRYNPSRVGVLVSNETCSRVRKMLKTGSDQTLKLCAIQLGAHNFWLQKLHKQVYMRINGVSWLTDLAMTSGKDGIKCLLECKRDVTEFIHPREIFAFCTNLLRNDGEPQFDVVKRVLTCILKDSASLPVDIKNTISYCRDLRDEFSSVLVPWICQLMKTYRFTNKVLFHGSLNASQAIFALFKRQLLEERAREIFQDDEGHEAAGAEAANQYMTPKPHPYLEVAYELGLKALESLDDSLEQDIVTNRATDMQTSLREFCDVVNYIVLQTWKKDKPVGPPEQPHEEGAAGPSDVEKTPSNRYLSQFVSQLINSVRNPMWMFDILKKLCTGLCSETCVNHTQDLQARQDAQIRDASSKYPLLSLVLQKNLAAFRNLLLGPKVTKLVERQAQRMPVHPDSWNPGYEDLEGSSFKEILRVTKRLHVIIDSNGSNFDKLTREIEAKHSILKPVLKAARKGEKKPRSQRRDSAGSVLGVAIIRRRRDSLQEFLFG